LNLGTRDIKIFVYPGDHPPPHCHVRRKESETRVAIPSMMILSGPELSKKEEEMVLSRLDKLCAEFDKLNPQQH